MVEKKKNNRTESEIFCKWFFHQTLETNFFRNCYYILCKKTLRRYTCMSILNSTISVIWPGDVVFIKEKHFDIVPLKGVSSEN